jgi:hypothetical protein
MIYLAYAGYRHAGPKILSDLALEDERLAQESTQRALTPKDGYGVQPLRLEMQLKTKTQYKDG